MKLIFAVVQNRDADALFRKLADEGIRATRIGSSGGYLRNANATIFIGIEEARLRHCLAIVEETCRRRVHRVAAETGEFDLASIAPMEQGGGVIFVMPVERFVRMERLPSTPLPLRQEQGA